MCGEGGYLVPECIYEPINSWQKFKHKYFPFWLLKIFPVKYNEIRVADLLREELKKERIK